LLESGRAGPRSALSSDYPVEVDKGYEIWSASANRYWPALCLRKLFNSPAPASRPR
jgi:hypothetical protein